VEELYAIAEKILATPKGSMVKEVEEVPQEVVPAEVEPELTSVHRPSSQSQQPNVEEPQ
jgi:hypothetical protein